MEPALLLPRDERLTHVATIGARDAVYGTWPEWLPEQFRHLCAERGITQPWAHQQRAAQLAYDGTHVIITTGTASGKSLCYQMPAIAAISGGRSGPALRGHRNPSVMYVAPTKALAADQAAGLRRIGTLARAATVDGDNDPSERRWAREYANWVLTNPDTLHHVLLPGHQSWSRLFGGLQYVILDECHHFRGVFGAHVAQIVRRLRRVCAHYGSDPTYIMASATIAEPSGFAHRLTGHDVTVVDRDDAPRASTTIALWEPPLIRSQDGQLHRRAPEREAAELLVDLGRSGVRSLAFVRSRRGAESLAARVRALLDEADPQLSDCVATYRGGYLAEDRRELERRLRDGELRVLATTSALELGIDIAGLDAIVTLGYPGTRASLWQQFGRAGREQHSSLGVLIARDDPLDTFLVHHPDALLDTPVEATVFDPDNAYVLGPHLAAAAQEIPLTVDDLKLFGPRAYEGIEALTHAGWLRRRAAGWYWTRRERASQLADLRSAGGTAVHIVVASDGTVLGTVDPGSADAAVHTGAVYVHQGRSYVVADYDPEDGIAAVEPADVDYTTMARSTSSVTIVAEQHRRVWNDAAVALGTVDVTSQVIAFSRRDAHTGRLRNEEPLDLPARTLRTTAVWWTLSGNAVTHAFDAADVPGAAHAAEHAAIGLLPLLATCDRWDLGGLSTALHPDTGMLTVFVHDGVDGGAGFAERGFVMAHHWLSVTRQAIAACSCATGCPSCIQSPKCGNNNEPLDKSGAIVLLDLLLADAQPDQRT